jgi:hypothetical protein
MDQIMDIDSGVCLLWSTALILSLEFLSIYQSKRAMEWYLKILGESRGIRKDVDEASEHLASQENG